MTQSDLISATDVISKIPELAGLLPRLVKGSRMGMFSNPHKPIGLGLAIEKCARDNPNGIAIIYRDTELSYHALNHWANQIAHYFQGQGFGKGDVVVVNIENRPELLATLAGLAKIGVCSALINTSQRSTVLTHSINLVKPKAAIIGEEMVPAVEQVRADLKLATTQFYFLADQDTRQQPGEAPAGYHNLAGNIASCHGYNPASSRHIFLNDDLFYIYTSGTTGLPKAVVFRHGRWHRAYGAFGYAVVRFTQADRLYCTLPLYHATGLVVGWGAVLAANAGIVLERKFSASRFWDDINRYQCTSFAYVGELCRYLYDQPQKPTDRNNPVKLIIGNGLRPGIWQDFKQRFGIERVLELYGSSEGNVAFTNVFNFNNTVGFSPVNYAIVKYDNETEQPHRNKKGRMQRCAKGEAGLMLGEITKKTPFEGYTDPEKSKKSVFRDVFKKGDAWFNTGDLMRDIGFRHAQFVDRLGDTFRWKGENVSTTEVEQIIDGHSAVAESVVYGVEIAHTNGRAGMAQIRLNQRISQIDLTDLSRYLHQQLAAFAVPVFLRINQGGMETTGTFKHTKVNLKKQGYDIRQFDDPTYVQLPGETGHQPLTEELLDGINNGQYRF